MPSVKISFSMMCDAAAISGGAKEALEAALRDAMTDLGGLTFMMGQTRVGPSDDTMQRVLPLVLHRMGPEDVWRCVQAFTPWRTELEAQGVCIKTFQLCAQLSSSLAQGGKLKKLGHAALRRSEASTGAEKPGWLDVNSLLQRPWDAVNALVQHPGSLHQWLQAASQEPDASFLSQGAASTAQFLGLPLVQWVGRPQGRYPGVCTLVAVGEGLAAVGEGQTLNPKP